MLSTDELGVDDSPVTRYVERVGPPASSTASSVAGQAARSESASAAGSPDSSTRSPQNTTVRFVPVPGGTTTIRSAVVWPRPGWLTRTDRLPMSTTVS